VTFLRALAVVVAGFVAGGMTAVVGAGSLASFPVLLAIGLSPVVANVTSAVGVVPGSIAGAYAYRHQLGPLRPLLVPLLLPTALGGVAGAALLLVLPAAVFSAVLPPLLVLAGGLVAFQPAIARAVRRRGEARGGGSEGPVRSGPVVRLLAVAVAVYGGYFGAAVSVMYLALLGALIGGLQASNGVKNVLTSLSCGSACLVFVFRADPDWAAVLLLAVGSTAGGVIAGRYGQRLPDAFLRAVIVVIALATAVVEALR
jgi:uncharacterized membrane protein YfcA